MKIESWHRRYAVMLASQLPDRIEDARIILRLVTALVIDFLAQDGQPTNAVVKLIQD